MGGHEAEQQQAGKKLRLGAQWEVYD